jgi:hypothetical protein
MVIGGAIACVRRNVLHVRHLLLLGLIPLLHGVR